MKIGMILDSDFPPDSRVENEAVSLNEAGHEVFLFSLSYKAFNKAEEIINGIQVKRYRVGKLVYKLSALAYPYPFYHLLVQPKIVDFIRKYNIEALHVHDMLIAPAVFAAIKNSKLFLTLDLHENRPEIMRFYPHLKKWPGKFFIQPHLWEKAQEKLVKRADRLILVTEEAKEYYVRKYQLEPNKIVVVPNTVHPNLFMEYPVKQEVVERFKSSFNLLYLGDTGLRRGLDITIRAVGLLKEIIPEIKLILVGKSSEDIILKRIVSESGLWDHIIFEGWQDVKLFPSYIKAADICLSPLSRNLHHDTTYANKIFQYMGMGKPLLVSDSTAQANVVQKENCGLVFRAGSVEEMKKAVIRMYKQPEMRMAMGKAGMDAVNKRWNWNITSHQLISAYEELGIELKK